MIGLLPELRYALRQVRKSPGFAATTVLTLTFAIGVATAAFSVLYAVLLRPLPYSQQERIVSLQPLSPQGFSQPASYPEYLAWREGNQSFQTLASVNPYSTINFEASGNAVALNMVEGSDNFFTIFGVNPIIGRTFLPGEDRPGKNNVVVLSHEVWQEQFGGRQDVIGQTAKMDGRPYMVIGVMPAGFRYPLGTRKAVYVPLHVPPAWMDNGTHWMQTVARLKPGVSLQQAQADMDRTISVLVSANRVPPGRRIRLQGLSSEVTGDLVAPFRVLILAVFAVLAIGCTNVAGLLMARGLKREHEFGIRVSMGATRWRVMRQLLIETLLLCAAGATGGVLLAAGLLRSTHLLLINAFARGVDVQINKAELLTALGLALLTTLFSGLLPAWRISGIEPNRALKASGATGSGRSQQRLRAVFVVVQVGIAFSLLIMSGLMLRSLARSLRTDLGISSDHLLTVDVSPSSATYETRDIVTGLYNPLSEKVRAIPGVREVGLVSQLPIRQSGSNADVHIVGHPPAPPNQEQLAELRFVTPGYFSALGLQLTRGRMLDESIDRSDSRVTGVVVNEAFVRKFLAKGEDPIGKQLDGFGGPKTEIVGVVRSVRQDLYKQPLAEMDFLVSQLSPADKRNFLDSLSMIIRTNVEPESIVPSLRKAFHDVDSGLPLEVPRTMPEVISDVLLFQRFQNWIFGTFAALALVLAIVGLYGLISQGITLSTREIGVRMALGASRGRTFAAIYRRVSMLLGGGISAGVLITFLMKKVLAAVVLISPGQDSGLIFVLAAGLLGIGLLATFLPALRASQINPMTAMRYE